jgi:hypothetical protein
MKNKLLITAAISFFVLVNTTYYWESNLGAFGMLSTLLLVTLFFILLSILFRQIFLAIKERFRNKRRLALVALLTAVLGLTSFKPSGLVNFEKLEGNDILVAEREGSANCLTIFKLKEDNKFTEKRSCFGMTKIEGTYRAVNDTIYFKTLRLARHENDYYNFAVIRPSIFFKDNEHFNLVMFKDLSDTTGYELLITKNDLPKLTHKKPNR